jgi:hypothetical protein
MNELMIHVERIVRPVGATEGRKLRMRQELLGHLEAALEEERRGFPGDERTAVERAKLRLGEPVELTRKLQRAVPMVERLMLTRRPLSRRLDRLEQKMARVPGQRGPMTLGHKMILIGVAMLVYAPLFMSMYSATTVGRQAIHLAAFVVGTFIGGPALIFASYRFVFAAADPDHRLDWPGTLKRGATIIALQIALAFFAVFTIADRCATIREFVGCAASTVALVVVSGLIARYIGVLRRPYDEWLTLNIAE